MNYCYVPSQLEQEGENEQNKITDNAVLIRGCNNSIMNRLSARLNFEFEEEAWKRPPPVALVLDHIYGVQTSDRRNTMLYMHFHGDKPDAQPASYGSITQQLGIVGTSNSRLD